VVEEVIQLVGTVWLDDEGVVHVTKPLSVTGESGESIATINLRVELAIEAEV
jgi:hypothetical protein